MIVLFEAKGEAKSTVAISHERLPDADEAARAEKCTGASAWRFSRRDWRLA